MEYVYIIIFVIVIIILSICLVIYRKRKKALDKLNDLLEQVNVALQEYDNIFTFRILVEEESVKDYVEKYSPLRKQIDAILHCHEIKKEVSSAFELHDFIDKYDHIKRQITIHNEIVWCIKYVNEHIESSDYDQKAFNSFEIYHSHAEIENHKSKHSRLVESIYILLNAKKLSLVDNEQLALVFKEEYDDTIQAENIKKYNNKFVRKKKEEDKDFFDNCLTYPLDDQQREAILRMEDNTLVISSAGSGKTSTMVGKARYMVDKCGMMPDDILILTYTRKAAEELTERLGIEGLTCFTFHSLAVKIIGELTGHKPSICEPDLLLNTFYEMLNNEDFKNSVNRYMLEMKSCMKLQHEYESSIEYYNDRKKYGIEATFKDFKDKIIYTKSEEERRICDWLSIHEIKFLYEEPYEYDVSDTSHRQYRPDFTIFYKGMDGEEHVLYIEHFAIDKNGNVPKWFGNNLSEDSHNFKWDEANTKYNDGIVWKQHTHFQYNTDLIYTTSAMFHDGTIWTQLEGMLRQYHVGIRVLSPDELYDKFVRRNKNLEKSIFKLIEQFIALQKSNCVEFAKLKNMAKENNDSRSEFMINNIIEPVSIKYHENLKAKGLIDFIDAIINATKLCNRTKWKNFKYIMIDEFQDISMDRYLFLHSLRTETSGSFTKMFCVGDDWQSIYRFSGSDMSLFYEFEYFFGFTEKCKIETTYRFFEPAISKSSKFIQKNPNQEKKAIKDCIDTLPRVKELNTIYSECVKKVEKAKQDDDLYKYYGIDLSRKNPSLRSALLFDARLKVSEVAKEIEKEKSKYRTRIECRSYLNEDDEKRQVEEIISWIPKNESILILGRYNYDARSLGFKFTKEDADRKVIYLNLCERKIRFMSIHASKGLEADHIIILNCNQGTNGFPSLIEDDPILNFVLSQEDVYENAEERRVFYVAITRGKKLTYIFYDEKKPSCFVDEIIERVGEEPYIPCPMCGKGHMRKLKEGDSTKGHWIFLGCNNYPAGCRHTEFVTPYEYNKNLVIP